MKSHLFFFRRLTFFSSTQSHLSVEQLKYGFMSLIDYSIGLTEEQTMLILYIKEVNYLGGEEIDCFISERKSIEDTDAYQKCFKIFLITQNLEHFINPPASEMAILKKIPGWNEAETSQSSEQTIKEDKVDDGVQESTNSKEPSQCSQYEVIDMEEESNSDEEMHRNNDVHHERKCTKDDSQAQKLPCNTQAPPAQFNHLYNESPKNSEWAYAPQKLEDNSNTSSSDAGKQAESESSFLSEKVVVGPLYEEREYSDRFLSSPEEGGTSSEWYKNEWLQNNGSKKMNRLKKKYSKEIETKKPRVSTTDDIVRKKTRDSKDSSTTETEKTTRKKRTNKFGYQYLLDAILSVIKRSKKM
ncbi:uncharacterized protein LOC126317492 isoform X2 [Schistocerca gregaria]|uniref:uncharacterized protein LOC126317492 isoform X2 n=1 Tax=Schistocerca gregaria TaxID=7010 RepID=UPI00211E299F|nr:uncharacterized protein LOC126317492 isoform X2 [Schistocerca gregaria]